MMKIGDFILTAIVLIAFFIVILLLTPNTGAAVEEVNVYNNKGEVLFTIPFQDLPVKLRDTLKGNNAKLVIVVPGK